MGVGSLLTPMISKKLLDPVTPTKGRHGKALLGLAAGAAVAASVGDVLRARHTDRPWPAAGRLPDGGPGWFEPLDDGDSAWAHLTGAAAATAVMSSAVALATTWATQTSANRLFARHDRDLGASPAVRVAALLGWDFLYYWNHRWAHESRWMWAMHVVHHSSERYNLSTALRQPVGEAVTLTVPYGLLALLGVRPRLIEDARALNLIYQFWIHTEVIRSIGRWSESSTRPRTTGSTTAPTANTSTATTARSSLSGTVSSAPSSPSGGRRPTASPRTSRPSARCASPPTSGRRSSRTSAAHGRGATGSPTSSAARAGPTSPGPEKAHPLRIREGRAHADERVLEPARTALIIAGAKPLERTFGITKHVEAFDEAGLVDKDRERELQALVADLLSPVPVS